MVLFSTPPWLLKGIMIPGYSHLRNFFFFFFKNILFNSYIQPFSYDRPESGILKQSILIDGRP